MALASPERRLSEAEYLELERKAAIKSEFYNGELFAMSGGTRAHSIIAMNVGAELRGALKGSGCAVFESNMRVKVEATGLYTYPDISVACEEQEFVDDEKDTLPNPTLIVEVLSESSELGDRGKKFFHYQKIPPLQEYLLVSETEPRVELFVRQNNGTWILHVVEGMDHNLESPTLRASLKLSEVFANIRFEPQPIRAQTKKPI